MSDCGCGCNGAGDCTDNLNSNAKNAQLTGNINYDGSALACSNNTDISIANGEGLNSIIQKVLTALCPITQSNSSYLAHTSVDNNLTNPIATVQTLNSVEFNGVNNIKENEMIKIKYTGTLSTVASTGGLTINFTIFGKDSSGATTTPVNFISATVPAGVTTTDQFVYSVEVIKISNTILHFSVNGETRLASIPKNISNNNIGSPNLSVYDLVINATASRNNIGDVFNLDYVSMEHIRP